MGLLLFISRIWMLSFIKHLLLYHQRDDCLRKAFFQQEINFTELNDMKIAVESEVNPLTIYARYEVRIHLR